MHLEAKKGFQNQISGMRTLTKGEILGQGTQIKEKIYVPGVES